jgi:hypothetical protein
MFFHLLPSIILIYPSITSILRHLVKAMCRQVLEMNGYYICIVNYLTQGNKYWNIQLSLQMLVKVVNLPVKQEMKTNMITKI